MQVEPMLSGQGTEDGGGKRSPFNTPGWLALCGTFVVLAFAFLGLMFWDGFQRQAAKEEAKVEDKAKVVERLVGLDAYPLQEADVVASCGRRTREVGACVLTEEAMLAKGAGPWREASADLRRLCLDEILGEPEAAARLYVCLRR